MATKMPVTMVPSRRAPRVVNACGLAGDRGHDEVDHDRRQHRQQRGDDHLADAGLGQHVHGLAVVGLVGAGHDAGLLAELPPHLLDDRTGGPADRLHAHGAEQVGQHAADEQADHDVGVGQAELDVEVREVVLQVLDVGGEQDQRGQGRPSRSRSPW